MRNSPLIAASLVILGAGLVAITGCISKKTDAPVRPALDAEVLQELPDEIDLDELPEAHDTGEIEGEDAEY